MTTRVLLADDHALLRAGLRSLIESQDDLSVVAEATNGRDAVQLARELTPDLVIIDITMPGMNGIEATAEIRDALPSTFVIALSMHATKRFVDRMLAAGATGYLLKDCAFAELRATIDGVMAGQIVVSARAGGGAPLGSGAGAAMTADCLTQREREVLQLLAEGKTSKEIAGICNISIKTVDTHRQHIKKKLNFGNLADLTKFAIREGLTSLDD